MMIAIIFPTVLHTAGKPAQVTTLADVYEFIQHLFEIAYRDDLKEKSHVNCLKKFLNFIDTGIGGSVFGRNAINSVKARAF
jgi:hypothetical protein